MSASVLAAAPVAAQAPSPLPEQVEIDVQGTKLRVAIPPGYCALLPAWRSALATEVQQQKQVLLGAAVPCAVLEDILKTGRPPGRMMTLAYDENLLTSPDRPSKVQFLRACFETYPTAKQRSGIDDDMRAFNEHKGPASIDEVAPLGLQRATRDTVIGATLATTSQGETKFLVVKVDACLAPAGVPFAWHYIDVLPRDVETSEALRSLNELVDLALAGTKATVRLNGR